MDNTNLVNISDSVLRFAQSEAMHSFGKIGVAVGAIFLLIVCIYYMISIMDGGKFQIKMLLPVLIFLLVCNFSWVSKPALAFCNAITGTAVKALASSKDGIMNTYSKGEAKTLIDLFWYMDERRDDEEYQQFLKEQEQEYLDVDNYVYSYKNASGNPKIEGVDEGGIKGAIQGVIRQEKKEALQSMDNSPKEKSYSLSRLTLTGMIASLIGWFAGLCALVLQALSIVMIALVVSFGPLTFAFAIWPGKGGTMLTWFLRMCQFSLYAPICMCIDVFILRLFIVLYTAENMQGTVFVVAMILASIVAFTSVPSIAAMIIEGAQGALSLSQGMQTITGVAGTAASVIGGAVAVTSPLGSIWGKNNRISNFAAGMQTRGISGFVSERRATGSWGAAARQILADGQQAHYFDRMGSNQQGGAGTAPSGPDGNSSGNERARRFSGTHPKK